jgi:Icc-related predicted phosphoesterase
MNLRYLKQLFLILLIFPTSISNSFATIPERVGWWKFDTSSDLTKAETGFGLPLILVGNHSATKGPDEENAATLIGVGSHYKMTHQILPKTGESKINEYTLLYDFKITETGAWRSFFQTSVNNSGDADLFINPGGEIGVAAVGYSGISITPNEWYRLIVSVKNGSHFNYYLDGQLLLKGNIQPVNGRFSLENQLLIFADEDGEDGFINCSELAIWDKALTAAEVLELGGFAHSAPKLKTRIPYLQSPGKNSIIVCWHDTAQFATKIVYGLDSINLNIETLGSSEIISSPIRWHSVKLSSLQPNTRYFYKVSSGDSLSKTHSFKTLPDSDYNGKLRFLMLSDTHNSDTTMAGKVIRQAHSKITELYGLDIENHITGIIHSGDIVMSGDSPGQYDKQFFQPLSLMTSNISTTVVAGNHEAESPFFYQYLKLDELSAYPAVPALNEKILQLRVGNSLFLGLNTNIINQFGTTQANWLNSKLKEVENDKSIDFVFLFFHHPPVSELWDYTNTKDAGTAYVRDVLLPVIKKYTKVQQMHYGHTHGFERGAILSEISGGDFRIICGGGGGGNLDPWATGENRDFNEINISISNYVFQILEIDIASQSYQNSVYSLGTLSKPKNGELIDSWYKKVNQESPKTPIIENVTAHDDFVQINTSQFSGTDSVMTVQIQILNSTQNPEIEFDTLIQRVNIYGVDNLSNPVDLNEDINIYQTKLPLEVLPQKSFYIRTRYRDNNLKWSNWSDSWFFTTTGIKDLSGLENEILLFQNFPNPFKNSTIFKYELAESSEVTFNFYDINNKIIHEKNEGLKSKGIHTFSFFDENLKSGIYLCEMISGNRRRTKTMVKIE